MLLFVCSHQAICGYYDIELNKQLQKVLLCASGTTPCPEKGASLLTLTMPKMVTDFQNFVPVNL